jgi:hypothetical protein
MNAELMSFIRMRQQLALSEGSKQQASKKQGKPHAIEQENAMTLNEIIEDKPPIKNVVKYFRERVQQLTAEN